MFSRLHLTRSSKRFSIPIHKKCDYKNMLGNRKKVVAIAIVLPVKEKDPNNLFKILHRKKKTVRGGTSYLHYCIFTDGPRKERYIFEGKFAADVNNELQFVAVPIPPRSMRVNVWASLDGINKLSADGSDEGFQVTFWAEEPMFESLRLDSNGKVVISRRPVVIL